MAIKNLAKLAKRSGGGAAKGSSIAKTETKKRPPVVVVKPITPEEEKQQKVKEVVENLLSGVDLRNPKEITEEVQKEVVVTTEQRENTEWLEEQLDILTAENERLTTELAETKQAYDNLYNNVQQYAQNGVIPQGIANQDAVVQMLVNEFRLIQGNLISMGVAQQPIQRILQPGEPLLIIHPIPFLNRLIDLFPFLARERKF